MRIRWVEIFVVLGVLFLLGVMTLSALHRRPKRDLEEHARIRCVNNLKQVALALKMWAGDHDDKYPFQVSTNSGGTREFVKSEDTYRHFIVLSNELGNPKVLICRSDFERELAIDFASLSNRNLSYFLNLAASERGPSTVLAGDRNIGLRYEGTNQQIRWGPDLHGYIGNICLNDGSTQVFDPPQSKINLEYYFRDATLSIPR